MNSNSIDVFRVQVHKNNTGLHLKKFLLTEQIACIPPNFGALNSKITFVFYLSRQVFLQKAFQFSADLE